MTSNQEKTWHFQFYLGIDTLMKTTQQKIEPSRLLKKTILIATTFRTLKLMRQIRKKY